MSSSKVNYSGLNVLIAENHSLMRRLLVQMLLGFGFELNNIKVARNASECLKTIYDEPFDLVILDYFLGKMNGGDFTLTIRKDASCRNRRIPVLLITSATDHDIIIKVKNAGVNEVLAKPMTPNDLYNRIYTMMTQPRPFIITDRYIGPAPRKTGRFVVSRPASKNRKILAKRPTETTYIEDPDQLLFG